ncbi:UNVERIFIED_CONTAM: Alkane hydroxylase MAH1 [Sesamum radiatum]|uniref:Alkane hydroxylase MAH1 n=1 Tax=Sesamum radiatum TaxID=300843 RepID=A0AAW2K2N5_SESRA
MRGTFKFKGPLFSNMDMVLTSDPANIHHIFSKNFSNYPKGPEFRKIFEILGDEFSMLIPNCGNFTGGQLFPCSISPGSLSADLPYFRCEKAFSEALEPLFHRHIVPGSIWKLQKWLKIGNEKKLIEAWKAFDDFIYPLISSRGDGEREESLNTLTAFRKAYEETDHISFSGDSRKFLRDSLLGLMFAGRDSSSTTLTWLFWLMSANPSAESKIRHEIETLFPDRKWRVFSVEESRKLVYLHAALCESLRLFPPIALELKSPCKPDTLPSGNHLNQNTKVIVPFYSTGRMESVWG